VDNTVPLPDGGGVAAPLPPRSAKLPYSHSLDPKKVAVAKEASKADFVKRVQERARFIERRDILDWLCSFVETFMGKYLPMINDVIAETRPTFNLSKLTSKMVSQEILLSTESLEDLRIAVSNNESYETFVLGKVYSAIGKAAP